MLPNAAPAQLPATFAAPVDNPSFNGPTNTLTNVDPAVVYTVDQNGNFAFGALNTPSPIQDMVATSPDAGLGSQIVYMSMPFQVIPGPSQGIVDSVAGSAQFLPMTPPAAVPGYVSVPNAGVSSNNRPNVLEQTLVYGVTSSSVPGPFLATPGVTPDSGIVPDKDSFTQYDGDTNYFQYPPTSKTQS